MAGSCTNCSTDKAFTNDSGTPDPTSAVSYALTPAPVQASAFTLALIFTPSLLSRYMDKNLQRATKLALKLFVKGQKYN